MDQVTIAGILVLTFKLGIFALLVLHTRQAARAVREMDAQETTQPMPKRVAEDPAPMREAA